MRDFERFPALKSRTAFVVDQILRAITKGTYRVGDQLPSERDLAEQMGVGRSAVREALSALQVMQVVERKIGDGTYVQRNIEEDSMVAPTLRALRENRSLGEVWLARTSVELVQARLAVQKADERNIKLLEDSLERITTALDRRDVDDYVDAHRDFHLALGEAAKNPFLQGALIPLLAITHQQVASQVTIEHMEQHANRIILEHRAIVDALRSRDPSRMTQCVKDHFQVVKKLYMTQSADAPEEE